MKSCRTRFCHRPSRPCMTSLVQGCGYSVGRSHEEEAMTKLMIAMWIGAVTLAAQSAKISPLLTKELAEMPGKEASMVMVEYAPGGSSAAHRHNAHVFVYVLEGTVVMQLKGGREVT